MWRRPCAEDLVLDEVYDLDELRKQYAPAQGEPGDQITFELAIAEFDRMWRWARERGCVRVYPN